MGIFGNMFWYFSTSDKCLYNIQSEKSSVKRYNKGLRAGLDYQESNCSQAPGLKGPIFIVSQLVLMNYQFVQEYAPLNQYQLK